ncbi:hypothetical protein TKK_0005312 [Trichogramma kaykai]
MAESEDTQSLLLRRLMVLGGGHHYTEADHRSNLLKDYPPWLLTFAAACCVLFMLVGIPGNLLTLFALFRTKKIQNVAARIYQQLTRPAQEKREAYQ